MLFSWFSVQFHLLLPSNPPQIASAHPWCVSDENIVLCQFCCLPEFNAGHLSCDVLHCVQHDFPLVCRERVIELALDHSTWPKPIRVGKRSIQSWWRPTSEVALADHNVAFQDGFADWQLPPSTNLLKVCMKCPSTTKIFSPLDWPSVGALCLQSAQVVLQVGSCDK